VDAALTAKEERGLRKAVSTDLMGAAATLDADEKEEKCACGDGCLFGAVQGKERGHSHASADSTAYECMTLAAALEVMEEVS